MIVDIFKANLVKNFQFYMKSNILWFKYKTSLKNNIIAIQTSILPKYPKNIAIAFKPFNSV